VIKKPRERGGHSPRWSAEPEKKLKGRDKFRDIKHIWEDNIKPYVKRRVS
jgi:hypothetical protein